MTPTGSYMGGLYPGRLSRLDDAVYATEELEETAKLFLALHGMRTRPLTPAQTAEIARRFPVEA